MRDRTLRTRRLWLRFAHVCPIDVVCSPSPFCGIFCIGPLMATEEQIYWFAWEFKEHDMWTSQLFVILIIAASGSSFCKSSCRRRVPCLVAPISIPNPTPVAMALSLPATRFGKEGSLSSIQETYPLLCYGI